MIFNECIIFEHREENVITLILIISKMIHFKLPIQIKNRVQTNIKFLGLGIDKHLDLKVNAEQIICHFTNAGMLTNNVLCIFPFDNKVWNYILE